MKKKAVLILFIIFALIASNFTLLFCQTLSKSGQQESIEFYPSDATESAPEYYEQYIPSEWENQQRTQSGITVDVDKALEPINADEYLLDTGDRIKVILFGRAMDQFILSVSPDGKVMIPAIGDVYVRGMSLTKFNKKLESILKKYYKDFRLSVALVGVRTYKVHILGEVKFPGAYVVNSFTRITELLSLAGGITRIGSWRNIELRRSGKESLKYIDFFKIQVMGDTSFDYRLSPGDTLFVPVRKEYVVLKGEVNRPGQYEISQTDKISDLIKLAGGTTPNASLSRAWLERYGKEDKRGILPLDLTGADSNVTLKTGDSLVIPSALLFQDTITLVGEFRGVRVFEKTSSTKSIAGMEAVKIGLYRLKQGEKVLDMLSNVGGVTARADLRKAQIIRLGLGNKKITIKVDLYKLTVENDKSQNIALMPGDIFSIPSIQDNVYLIGEVRKPGAVPYSPGRNIADYIAVAGGPTDRAILESVRIIRGTPDKPEVETVHLRKILSGQKVSDNTNIEAGDIIYIPKTTIVDWRDIVTIITDIYIIKRLINP
ncbi:MAG: SLBB domain-containing protein [Actinobacteria bacterium]|nr:SLBB domain-containing protein [Actinomycetota bacterium]